MNASTILNRNHCRCHFEMPGNCPGPSNCPMCQEDDEDSDDPLYCDCGVEPTIEEQDTNQCDACGKAFA